MSSDLPALRRKLAGAPADAGTVLALSAGNFVSGALGPAAAWIGRASAIAPADLAVVYNGAIIFQAAGDIARARRAFDEALSALPMDASLWRALAESYLGTDEPEEAARPARRAVALGPDDAAGMNALGLAAYRAGRSGGALWLARALLLHPDEPLLISNLANARLALGEVEGARRLLESALARAPRHASLLINLANTCAASNRPERAQSHAKQAMVLEPALNQAHRLLGILAQAFFAVDEAIVRYRRAIVTGAAVDDVWDNLFFCMCLAPGFDDRRFLDESRRWARSVSLGSDAGRNVRATARSSHRLRIGYLAPDFRQHKFRSQIVPLLERHDRDRFEIVWYSDAADGDDNSGPPRQLVDVWRDVAVLTDREKSARIRRDRIDVLVNLLGFMTRHRRLFAERLAPIQVAYGVHFSTTGLDTMDLRISDRWADPPGVDGLQTERLVRLDGGFLCYSAPPRVPYTSRQGGPVRFGTFNAINKLQPPGLALWARILRALPEARLTIKARELDEPAVLGRVRALIERHGLPVERVELVGGSRHLEDYLRAISAVDIALDPVPFTGGFTTIDCLWMGVPVVTLAGPTLASRFGWSNMARIDLPELVAHDEAAYVDIAVKLAQDAGRVSGLRAGLRERLARSSLMDFGRHARELEAAYRFEFDALPLDVAG